MNPEGDPREGDLKLVPFLPTLRPQPAFTWSNPWLEQGARATHPFEVAHGLEVDEIGLLGLQGRVPVATVGLVVPHGEGLGLGEAAGRQLCPEVVHGAAGHGVVEGERHREAFLPPQLPLQLLGPVLLHDHLVGAGEGQAWVSFGKNGPALPWTPLCQPVLGSYPPAAPTYLMGAPLPWAGRSSTVMVLSDSLRGDGMSP